MTGPRLGDRLAGLRSQVEEVNLILLPNMIRVTSDSPVTFQGDRGDER